MGYQVPRNIEKLLLNVVSQLSCESQLSYVEGVYSGVNHYQLSTKSQLLVTKFIKFDKKNHSWYYQLHETMF